MQIQGAVFYDNSVWSQKVEKQIVWDGGFIDHIGTVTTANETFIVGLQGKFKNEVKLWGKPSSLASFFDFKDNIRTSADKLCIGVWHEEHTNRTHLARDIFGLCPLYYIHIPSKFFAFSTCLHNLLLLSQKYHTPSIHEERLDSFMTYAGDMRIDYTGTTFYHNIKSVLPGHLLSVDPQNIVSAPFVKFNIPYPRTSLSDFASDFRTSIKASVFNNLPLAASTMGSHLSGGLDSSTVSTLVKEFAPDSPLHTFYYDTQGNGSDDREFALLVAREIHSKHHELVLSNGHLNAIQSNTAILGYPQPTFVSPIFQEGVFKLAAEAGCRILFNGNGGDSIVGSGFEQMAKLYRQKDWALLKDLLRKRTLFFSRVEDFPDWDKLTFEQRNSLVENNFLFRQLSGSLHAQGLTKAVAQYRELSGRFDLSPSYFTKRAFSGLLKKLKRQSILPITLLRDDFRESTYSQRARPYNLSSSLRGELPDTYQSQFEELFNQHTILQNENRVILGAHYGFRTSSPFFNKALFELCMSVPEDVKFGNGLGRMHFREAMKGILPDRVRLRSQKTHVGPYGRQSTLEMYAQAHELLHDTTELWHYIDRKKFAHAVKFLKTAAVSNDEFSRSLFHITRVISLAAWLDWLGAQKAVSYQSHLV